MTPDETTREDRQWDRAIRTLDVAAAVIVAGLVVMLCVAIAWRWLA